MILDFQSGSQIKNQESRIKNWKDPACVRYGVTVTFTSAVVQQHISPAPPSPE
jgi:hypothetical protein